MLPFEGVTKAMQFRIAGMSGAFFTVFYPLLRFSHEL